jgi:hypothetical protein
MMEIGDCFQDSGLIYRVIKFWSLHIVECEVYSHYRNVGKTSEHRNTLLKMRKLSSLEKELM